MNNFLKGVSQEDLRIMPVDNPRKLLRLEG